MSTHAVPASAQVGSDARASRAHAVLALLCVAQFMVAIDVTVVNLALPSIGRTLALTAGDLAWVVTSYTLAVGCLVLLGGRAADLLGARRILLSGLGVFTAASLAAGLAGSGEILVAARVTQGIGAAMLVPGALAVLVSSFGGKERVKALAAWAAVGAAGGAFGVLLGGALTTWASWRWAFIINVPVGVLATLGILRWIPRDGVRERGPVNLRGAGAVTVGLLALVYAIQDAQDAGWGSAQTVALLALAAAALAGFAAIERRAPHPLVTPGFMRAGSAGAGAALMLLATGLLVGVFFISSLYMQTVLGLDALEAGLGFVPLAIAVAIGSRLGMHALPAVGTRRTAVAGLCVTGVGGLLLSGVGPDGAYASDVLPGLLVVSAGLGLVLVTASVTSMNGVDEERVGLASGVMTTAHEIGAAIGVAVLAAVIVGVVGAADDLASRASGFANAYLAAAVAAWAGAAIALVAFPSIRPDGSERPRMH